MFDPFAWTMTGFLSVAATLATIGGALLTASNLGARITGRGFIVFTVGSLAWLGLGLSTGQPALIWTNVAMTFLNLFGVWRWLGRQAKVEEGGKAASQASEARPGETLFPVSRLAKAKVFAGGEEVGSCVDAMAGCGSGQLAYVVVSEGGVAGVGERLRKLPWDEARMEGDRLLSAGDQTRFCSLTEIARDEWPAR